MTAWNAMVLLLAKIRKEKRRSAMGNNLVMSVACLATLGTALEFCPFASAASCSPTFVRQVGRTITVLPTKVDDTANLQCAFDSAVARGQGTNVQLVAGTYNTGQIVVNNFKGAFIGAGAERSVLTNLPNKQLYVSPGNFIVAVPSPANPWPSLVSFVDGDFQVSDIGIAITGAAPTTGWTLYGLPTLYRLAHGFVVVGAEANASFSHVEVQGQDVAPDPVTSYNLYNGIYFEGAGEPSPPIPPISGSFIVRDSTFRHVGSAIPVATQQMPRS